MNGAHDLGGMDGFGPVAPEPDEPVFHAAWERRAFALTVAMGFAGAWNIDMSRHARERMDPAAYLRAGYYEKWLHGLETLLVETGLVTRAELAAPHRARPSETKAPALTADRVGDALRRGGSARRADGAPARFKPGERVVVRNLNPRGHTRAPRYVRCKQGTVERDHGVFVLPDSNAHGLGEQPQHVYSVRFTGPEVWGPDGAPHDTVYVDLWDDYLDPA